MFNWIRNFQCKRNTKKFIKMFLENVSDSVFVKKWEHQFWGDAIYFNEKGLYGHLSGLRGHRGFLICRRCDLQNRDVLIIGVPRDKLSKTNGKKYDIGLFANVQVQNNPPDMFFAQYVRLGFADDYSKETIIKLAEQRIKEL
ncbi:MAG: hypothetical protein K2L55_10510 [Muribaculaceae bacterium]|nr:hypothetical protein [Muribaculaceae bacterium]